MTKITTKTSDIVRSVIFNFFLIFGSLAVSIALIWTWVLPKNTCARIVGTIYGAYIDLIERTIMGLKLEMRGLEHLPKDHRFIIAAKHQSAYETLKIPFSGKLGFPVIILKKILVFLPIWGIYTLRMGEVPIDRSAGTKALTKMSEGCRHALDSGRPIIIFPQGTRVAVDAKIPYKAGLAKLYKDLNVTIVPMALNSGVFWGKNSFIKKPGTIVFEFLPPIKAGLPPLQMMEKLEKDLETASNRLVTEGQDALSRRS